MNNIDFEWAIIGAGPAGIAAVGKLIDHHVNPKKIVWFDPEFKVGDFGLKWHKVPSNTKVHTFNEFLHASQAFNYQHCQENFALHTFNPEKTCELRFIVEPLQWVTEQLREQVSAKTAWVTHLKLKHKHWEISLETEKIFAKNVILATGADPKTLSFPNVITIPLEIAFDCERLPQICDKNDTIAVFGSSHSAILIIRNLLETCHLKKVINFYKSPLRYAVYFDDWILFDNTGLKGTTAEWAREHIDGKLPPKLHRVLSSDENLQEYLPNCTKVIYAVGFQTRLISIEGLADLSYNDKTGIIAPGLFGLGIGFPEAKFDRMGNLEYRVGLRKFMEYLHEVMPLWLKYPA